MLFAILEALARQLKVVGRPVLSLVRLLLARTLSQGSRVGDARTVAHVQKQLQQYRFESTSGLQLAFQAYDLAVDPLNRALVHRNAGDSSLSKGDREAAAHEFQQALALATQCGSRATALKALVGLYVCGQTVRRTDFDAVRGITGEGYEQFLAQFETLVQ